MLALKCIGVMKLYFFLIGLHDKNKAYYVCRYYFTHFHAMNHTLQFWKGGWGHPVHYHYN